MGAVYLAERADEQYQKRVAIKVIKRGMDTDTVLRHFRKERQILATFDHPNIARLFDAGTTADGLPYFVMEYVDGIPLDQYCEAHRVAIPEWLKLFREVCAAVSYAHRHTVIHRDIKPSNILVTNEGVPKLLDFGIAKMLSPSDGAETLATATGLRPMTPYYASPEQIRAEPVTTATDVFSLGVVLYELLTGSSPYRLTNRSQHEIERAITEQEPTKPSTVNRESSFEDRESGWHRFTVHENRQSGSDRSTGTPGRPGQHRAHGVAQGAAAPLPISRTVRGRYRATFGIATHPGPTGPPARPDLAVVTTKSCPGWCDRHLHAVNCCCRLVAASTHRYIGRVAAGKDRGRFAVPKPEQGPGERLLHRWRARRNSHQPFARSGFEGDQSHERDAIQRSDQTQST